MEKLNMAMRSRPKKRPPNSETAYIVFGFLEKHKIEPKNDVWAERLKGGMLKLCKKNKELLIKKIALGEEALDMMKVSEDKVWRDAYKNIIASPENKVRFFWNKILK